MSHRFRSTDAGEATAELDFARLAAGHFKNTRHLATVGDLGPGEYLAIRWGIMDRGVMVVKLDPDHIPTLYRDMILEIP